MLIQKFSNDTRALIIVESTFVLPLIFLIFAALVFVSAYLPIQTSLQRATQFAATALATESSDTWLVFNENTMNFEWKEDKGNVYADFVKAVNFWDRRNKENIQKKSEVIVQKVEADGFSIQIGELSVDTKIKNYIVYKEIVVTATRSMEMPIKLPEIIGFPSGLTVTVTSTAVVHNADEFVRNMDLVIDFISWLIPGDGDVKSSINKVMGPIDKLLGW